MRWRVNVGEVLNWCSSCVMRTRYSCKPGEPHAKGHQGSNTYSEHVTNGRTQRVVNHTVLEQRVLLDECVNRGVVCRDGQDSSDHRRDPWICTSISHSRRCSSSQRTYCRINNELGSLQSFVIILGTVRRVVLDVLTLNTLEYPLGQLRVSSSSVSTHHQDKQQILDNECFLQVIAQPPEVLLL